jgi:hypothetical protein
VHGADDSEEDDENGDATDAAYGYGHDDDCESYDAAASEADEEDDAAHDDAQGARSGMPWTVPGVLKQSPPSSTCSACAAHGRCRRCLASWTGMAMPRQRQDHCDHADLARPCPSVRVAAPHQPSR